MNSALFTRRESFLHGLRGKQQTYKRYTRSPLRYAGGKSLAVGHIVERMPDADCLVSPFVGDASLEIAAANELGMRVTAYDVFGVLTNYWQVQLSAPGELADRLMRWEPAPAQYRAVKERLRRHWRGEEAITDALELAAHYWFNHNLSYGPGFLGWMSSIYADADRYRRIVERVRRFRCPGLSVAQGSFEDTIPAHDGAFLYCDPPYYLEGDSKMFRGIYPQRNFPVHHDGFRHDLLRDLLHAHRGGFILSYNDCSVIRDWYSGCRIVEVAWQYTLGQGETRIGANRVADGNSHVKPSHELLIIVVASISTHVSMPTRMPRESARPSR